MLKRPYMFFFCFVLFCFLLFFCFFHKEKVCEVMFFDMKKYVYSESVFNIPYIEMKHKCKKNTFGQNKRYKICPLSRAPTHHSFIFNLRFLYEPKHNETVKEIFHFRFRSVFSKVSIFVQQIAWTL